MQRVDVAVVGGGPAGTAAAWAAAEAGADALAIEKGVPRSDRDELGPDSTDAAGMLDYWVDIMGIHPDELPDDVVLATLDGADFIGPTESVTLHATGIDASYDEFGYAFHRARFDDWLREQAEAAGATYHVGDSVTNVATDLTGSITHELALASGETVTADYLILADGPQRTITSGALDQFMPDGESVTDTLSPTEVNHIAYQEHREVPPELFEGHRLKFWWGVMPGHTAYPWIFPNDGTVARIGLTMPIGLDIADYDPSEWALLREDDEQIPRGATYIRRLIEREFPNYDLADFPLVEDRGKSDGTETYPISSTRPIESPTAANVAVVGGAMGSTSAFHEGGDHVAIRTGKIAGQFAAEGSLAGYNDAWQAAIGEEVARNVALADIVEDYGPDDWDRAFATARSLTGGHPLTMRRAVSAGIAGIRLVGQYKIRKWRLQQGGFVQLSEDAYTV